MDDVIQVLIKLNVGWNNADDNQRRDVLTALHNLGVSIKGMGILLGITHGQARYAYWKFITSAA